MADYIDREEEIKSWEKAKEIAPDEHYSVDEIINSLKDAPSVDAVEVVRCKDCKYKDEIFCTKFELSEYVEIQTLSLHHKENAELVAKVLVVNDDDFCKWGEKE